MTTIWTRSKIKETSGIKVTSGWFGQRNIRNQSDVKTKLSRTKLTMLPTITNATLSLHSKKGGTAEPTDSSRAVHMMHKATSCKSMHAMLVSEGKSIVLLHIYGPGSLHISTHLALVGTQIWTHFRSYRYMMIWSAVLAVAKDFLVC